MRYELYKWNSIEVRKDYVIVMSVMFKALYDLNEVSNDEL